MNTKTIIQRLVEAGFKPRSYSGRGMYGRECLGVVFATADERYEAEKIVGKAAVEDSMGKRYIAYWPAVAWPADSK
ncbi:MAG: hypothetical protein EBY17_31515 [Acidobacteriia bacterium]|nr:hypothetical protein [Terriglobia bacterium]